MKGQTAAYLKIKKLVMETHPEISTDNRLIAFNIWSMEDAESREANKGFEKAYYTYEYARLKGGSRGIIVISVSREELSPEAVITLSKDGISKLLRLKLSDIEGLEPGVFNAVYDSNGNEVYRNLGAASVYSSVNHLITR